MRGNILINEMLKETDSFVENGKGYDLLQEYFNGYSLDTLVPLLNSENNSIQGEAIWIVSELGERGCSYLLDSIIPLLAHDDNGIRYFALECIFLGSYSSRFDDSIYLIDSMESEVEYISFSAMHLLSNANQSQLEACKNIDLYIEHSIGNYEQHLEGIKTLLDFDRLNKQSIISTLAIGKVQWLVVRR